MNMISYMSASEESIIYVAINLLHSVRDIQILILLGIALLDLAPETNKGNLHDMSDTILLQWDLCINHRSYNMLLVNILTQYHQNRLYIYLFTSP